jgi:NADPH2:quinone reductase
VRAVWYRRQGPAREVLEFGEVQTPSPAAHEALVRLHASGVNPADCNRRSGRGHAMTDPLVVPHSDGAGIVEEVGASVDRRWLGKRVWLYNGQRGRALGTAAQYISIDAGLLAELPPEIDFAQGACLGIPCLTAWCALLEDGPIAGQWVLVTGGAGAVGHYAIQLAAWAGARVVATVSSEQKAGIARQAGALYTADYRDPACAERLFELTEGAGFERIVDVDFGRNLALILPVCADNATVAAYASRGDESPRIPFYDLLRRNLRVHHLYLATLPAGLRATAQAEVGRWLRTAGGIHRIAATFPLERTAQAHEAVERGDKHGTVVVSIDDTSDRKQHG